MKNELTKLEAFKAMTKFLEKWYELTKSDDIGSLLGGIDINFWCNGKPFDPALWGDWLDAINVVFNKKDVDILTVEEAFEVVTKFLEKLYVYPIPDDIQSLLSGMGTDPAFYEDWKKSIFETLKSRNNYWEKCTND